MPTPQEKTPQVTEEICRRLMKGQSLSEVCLDDFMPPRWQVYEWLAADKDFANNYARACEVRADHIFDEMLDIADDGSNDWMERKNADGSKGDTVLDAEHVQRSRLRIDARKWALARMNPRKYGDKMDLSGNVGFTVTIAGDDADL